MTLTLYLGYIVGKIVFEKKLDSIRYFYYGIFLCFGLSNIYFLIQFAQHGTSDLMKNREILLQRIPMVICFLSIVAFTLGVKIKKNRYLIYLLYLPGLILVLLSFTRAVYLQMIICLFFLLTYFLWHKPLKTILLSLLAVLFLSGVLFYKTDILSQLNERINSFSTISAIKKDASSSYRLKQWSALFNNAKQNPIKLIIGYGQLGASYIETDIDNITSNSAHNQYIDVWIREGIFGLLFFLAFFFYVLHIGFFKLHLFPKEYRTLIFANSVGLIGVFFYGFFHESIRYFQFGYYFMFYSGILSFLIKMKKEM